MRVSSSVLVVSLCVVVSALGSASAHAQTSIPGGTLAADATWTSAGSPYTVEGDLTVPDGITLRIEDGVEVQVSVSRRIAIAGGVVRIVGTEARPVTLRSTADGSRWQGLVVGASGLIDLEHATFLDVILPIDTQNGGSLRFVTVPAGASIDVRGGNLSIRDSELAAVDFSGTGTTSTFRSIFRGSVFFRGARAFVEHATIVGDVVGTGGADIFDSIIVQPRDLDCACVLDRVLIAPRSRSGTSVSVDEIRNGLEMEDALLGVGLRPTSRSPARFRDSAGADLGARSYAGEATTSLRGWLWDDVRMTPAIAEDVTGDLTIPPGHSLVVDPGVSFSFPFGADELEYELRVFGTMTWGSASGPPVRVEGSVTRDGAWRVIAAAPTASITLRNVITSDVTLELDVGTTTIEDADLSALDTTLAAGAGSMVTLDRVRSDGAMRLDGAVDATNLYVVARGTGLTLSPSSGRVALDHTTVRCRGPAGTTGVRASAIVTGTVSVARSVITGCGVGLAGSATGLTIEHSIVGANTVDAMGIVLPGTVSTADPRLSSSGIPMTGSPCIDAATGSTETLDLDRVTRPVDGDGASGAVADLGAFEIGRGTCGDGVIDPGERCDDGATPRYGWDRCAADCRGHGPYCGDGVVSAPDEACDGSESCSSACALLVADAGPEPDAGVVIDDDAGSAMDAGALDASTTADSGGRDAASSADAVTALDAYGDAALPDARGAAPDAGAPVESGGCGCRAAGVSRSRNALALAVALGVITQLRRGRRRRSR